MESLKRKGSPTKIRKSKKLKKQDGIKKPTSAYLYFVDAFRKELKKKDALPSKVQETAKICGKAWKAMSEEEKTPYKEKYEKDKARYLKEKEAWYKEQGKDPSKPKRVQTAYFFFLHEFREEMKGKTLAEGEKIPALAGGKWRSMCAEDKKKYEQMTEKDKQRFDKEMVEWKKTHPDQPKKPVTKKKVEVEEASSDDDSDDDDSDDYSEESEDDESD